MELGRLEGRGQLESNLSCDSEGRRSSSCPATAVIFSFTARRYEAGLNTLVMRVASILYCLADWLS